MRDVLYSFSIGLCFVVCVLHCMAFADFGARRLLVTPFCRLTSIRSIKRLATRVFSSNVKTLTALVVRSRTMEYSCIKVQKCFEYRGVEGA